ncbi:MAG: BadF/BadG/BcrA/BcrD ATPase family protein, partial [Burkholderiaceae bacterium]
MLDDVDYLIGVDGGGTATRVVVVRADHQPVGSARGGASALSRGVEPAWQHVQQAVRSVFADAGLAFEPARCAIGLGIAGANSPSWLRAFYSAAPAYGRVRIDTDGFAMLLGAHGGEAGAIVAAGTGAVGESLLRDGSRRFVGGWGFPVGDEGSGAWLGLHAMRAAQHAHDGRATAGALAKAVWERVGGSADDLLEWSMNAGAASLAELAPLVFDTQAQDAHARRLIEGAVQSLIALARALDPERNLPL